MPSVRANGLDIAYDVRGDGPPLVMLHGATSSGREDFAAQLPLLAKAFTVYLPDARGHAGTRWDAADGFRYEWLVDDAAAFADAVGLRSFHLLGFSMGAMTALQLAVRASDRLRTLVVVGITTFREPRASVARRLMDPERVLARDPAWAAELSRRHDPVQGPGAWQRLLPALRGDIETQPLLEPVQLHAIDCPTLVVCGDRDPFVPVEHASGLARQIPDAQLLVVPGGGHEVMVRRPGLFNEAIAGFYRSTTAVAERRAAAYDGAGGVAVSGSVAAGLAGSAAAPAPVDAVPFAAGDLDGGILSHPAAPDVPDASQTDTHWMAGRDRAAAQEGGDR